MPWFGRFSCGFSFFFKHLIVALLMLPETALIRNDWSIDFVPLPAHMNMQHRYFNLQWNSTLIRFSIMKLLCDNWSRIFTHFKRYRTHHNNVMNMMANWHNWWSAMDYVEFAMTNAILVRHLFHTKKRRKKKQITQCFGIVWWCRWNEIVYFHCIYLCLYRPAVVVHTTDGRRKKKQRTKWS